MCRMYTKLACGHDQHWIWDSEDPVCKPDEKKQRSDKVVIGSKVICYRCGIMKEIKGIEWKCEKCITTKKDTSVL